MEEQLGENVERRILLSDNLPDGVVYQIDSREDNSYREYTYISANVEHLYRVTSSEVKQDASVIYGQIIEEDRHLVVLQVVECMAKM